VKISILIPVYNDWESVSQLVKNIDLEVKDLNHEVSVIIINDASLEKKELNFQSLENLNFIELIDMKQNRGHARCIASGLKYIFEKKDFDYIIPMDGDGEDRPSEIKDFIEYTEYSPNQTIVGERVKRSENLLFKICYIIHKILTYFFTGKSIKFGNFTCLTKSTVEKMINEKASWSSFSGALTKIEKNRKSIPSIRGTRYFGPSKMSFLNLIKHSFAIISVFKINVLIHSILFLIIYFFLIINDISIVTLIPIPVVLILNVIFFKLSKRENLEEYKNCLENIEDIVELKKNNL
tara:strand:+ start:818 stop:1699 length:882 start_codon:yes stop_codon:yes gene_type:complete